MYFFTALSINNYDLIHSCGSKVLKIGLWELTYLLKFFYNFFCLFLRLYLLLPFFFFFFFWLNWLYLLFSTTTILSIHVGQARQIRWAEITVSHIPKIHGSFSKKNKWIKPSWVSSYYVWNNIVITLHTLINLLQYLYSSILWS